MFEIYRFYLVSSEFGFCSDHQGLVIKNKLSEYAEIYRTSPCNTVQLSDEIRKYSQSLSTFYAPGLVYCQLCYPTNRPNHPNRPNPAIWHELDHDHAKCARISMGCSKFPYFRGYHTKTSIKA